MFAVYLRRFSTQSMREFLYLRFFVVILLCFTCLQSNATHFFVNTLSGNGHSSLSWALNQVNNDKTATLSSPHVIDILASGESSLSPLPTQHCIINCPKDMSLKLSGINYNQPELINGLHICINNAVFDKANYNAENGSAVACGSGINLTLSDCLFINNASRFKGGAVFSEGDSVYLYGCTFKNNSTTNSSGSGGAAVFNNRGYIQIANCTFSNNTSVAINGGGGAINNAGEMDITNCHFYNNQSANTGGAIFNQQGAVCRISNNVFSGNGAANNGNDLKGEFIWMDEHNHFETAPDVTVNLANLAGSYKANSNSLLNTALLTAGVGVNMVKNNTPDTDAYDLNQGHEFTIVTCDEEGETTEIYAIKNDKITFIKGQITKLRAIALLHRL